MGATLSGIFKRILKSPEEELLEKVLSHAEMCCKAVEYLSQAIECSIKGEKLCSDEKISLVMRREEEADAIRREIVSNIAKGVVPPLSREDFVRLTEKMDMIADWAKEASRILKIIELSRLDDEMKELISRMIKLTLKCSGLLYSEIAIMKKDFEGVIKIAHDLEEVEELVDELYVRCLHKLGDMSSRHGCELILYEKLIESIENLTDACEDVSDVIKAIVIRALR